MCAVRLKRGDYYADIIRDSQLTNIWMYVVQRHGSRDILALGSCQSAEEAENAALGAIDALRLKHPTGESAAAT